MNRFKQVSLALATVGVLASSMAQAALHSKAGGTLVYDDVANITWLADANYAKTSGYDADGLMSWSAAKTWADNLVYGGYSDWRLPKALNADSSGGPCMGLMGLNCTGSEMGHLFYIDGGLSPFQSITSSAILNNYFTNMQSDVYWSGDYWEDASWEALVFRTYDGAQSVSDYAQSNEFYAWAVHPGDVAAVPEPEVYAMLLAGLGVLGVVARRRKQESAV